jgi:hypothetical protein
MCSKIDLENIFILFNEDKYDHFNIIDCLVNEIFRSI